MLASKALVERVDERDDKRVFNWKCNSRYLHPVVTMCIPSTRNELDRRGRSGSFERLGCRPWNLRFVCCTWKPRKPGENGNFAAAGCIQGCSPWWRNKTKQENQIQRPLLMCHYHHHDDSFRGKEYSIFKSFIKYKNFIGRERMKGLVHFIESYN